VTVFGHQLVVEPGQLRILPPGRVRGLEERQPEHAGPSLVIARLGCDTVPEDQVDGFNPT